MLSDKLSVRLIRDGNRALGDGTFEMLSGATSAIRRWYSTGIPALDVVLSGKLGKGIPSGRLVELFGDEQTGKTTLICLILKEIQRFSGLSVLFDTERSFDEERARFLGINVESLVLGTDDYVEAILSAIEVVLKKTQKCPCCVAWDTLAGTPTSAERSKRAGEYGGGIGDHARVLSNGLRRLTSSLSASEACLVITNQLKTGGLMNPFATERDKESTLGGRAMKFHAYMRVRLHYARKFRWAVDKKAVVIGDEIEATVIKDKNGPSNIRGRNAILVLRKVGRDAGTFSASLSALRTLQLWGVLPAKDPFVFAKKPCTAFKWDERYNTEPMFQQCVHALLEAANAKLLRDAAVLGSGETTTIDDTEEEEL